MKQLNPNIVTIAHLKVPYMQKVILLILVGIFTVFFSFSQCKENAQRERIFPLIGQSKIKPQSQKAEIELVAVKSSENIAFPIYYEWRKNSEDGEILKQGKIEAPWEEKFFLKNSSFEVPKGVYYLKLCDASEHQKYDVVEVKIVD